MGKTKTAFVEGVKEETKTSAQKYAEKKAKQAAEKQKEAGLPEAVQEKVIEEVTRKEKPAKEGSPRSKKYLEAKAKVNRANFYKAKDAIKLVKEISNTKFDGTMEVHLTVKKQGLSAQVTLPHSFGKAKKIEVADEKTVEKLKTGKIDFDVLLTTADMMPKLVMFAKLLGPRGLMPNPKNGTLIKKASDAAKFSTATLSLKTEKEQPIIHSAFGKVSQKDEELSANLETILNALGVNKQIVRAFIKSTMSPSIKLHLD